MWILQKRIVKSHREYQSLKKQNERVHFKNNGVYRILGSKIFHCAFQIKLLMFWSLHEIFFYLNSYFLCWISTSLRLQYVTWCIALCSVSFLGAGFSVVLAVQCLASIFVNYSSHWHGNIQNFCWLLWQESCRHQILDWSIGGKLFLTMIPSKQDCDTEKLILSLKYIDGVQINLDWTATIRHPCIYTWQYLIQRNTYILEIWWRKITQWL